MHKTTWPEFQASLPRGLEGRLDLPTVLTQLLTTTTFRAGAVLIQDLLARDAARKANPPTDGR